MQEAAAAAAAEVAAVEVAVEAGAEAPGQMGQGASPLGESAASFFRRCLRECGVAARRGEPVAVVDPIAGHAFERLWRYVFVDDEEASV